MGMARAVIQVQCAVNWRVAAVLTALHFAVVTVVVQPTLHAAHLGKSSNKLPHPLFNH